MGDMSLRPQIHNNVEVTPSASHLSGFEKKIPFAVGSDFVIISKFKTEYAHLEIK